MNFEKNSVKPAFRDAILRCVVALAVLLCSASYSAATRRERVITNWKPLNYNVSLSFNSTLTEITKARAEISILVLREKVSLIDLDFGELEIDSVTIGNRAAKYERASGGLQVYLSTPVQRGASVVIVVRITENLRTA